VATTNYPIQLAPISMRAVAFGVDMMIGALLRSITQALPLPDIPIGENGTLLTDGILLIVLSFLYFCVLPLYLGGRTPGKLLLGIRIMSLTEKPLTIRRLFVRNWLGYIGSGLLIGIGFFWATVSSQRQTWHDIIAETVVVKD
jgi:uncharacterized RDD family membrane protein YckC